MNHGGDRTRQEDIFSWKSSHRRVSATACIVTPFRVNQKIKELEVYPKLANPSHVRIVWTILGTFKQGDKNVRWFVMADDDTVLFVGNIVDVLAKYDHTKYLYIGTNSECIQPNSDLSFNMAYGEAGIALSYTLAQALASMVDECIERYPYLLLSDFMLHTCLIDFGIDHLAHERGFHQVCSYCPSSFFTILKAKSSALCDQRTLVQ